MKLRTKLLVVALSCMPSGLHAAALTEVGTWNAANPVEAKRSTAATMVVKGIGDNFLYVLEADPTTGALPISGSISATNPSIGLNTVLAPTSSTQVGGVDAGGLLQALKVDVSGALFVNTSGAAGDTNYGTPTVNTSRTAAMLGVGSTAVSAANPVPVSDAGGSLTVDATSWPLPTGASTSALQTTGNTSLASIDAKLTAPLAVSAASLPLPAGAATAANQATQITSLSSIDTKLTAPLVVSGFSAVGVAPVNNPVSVSGVDGGGLKRHILTDTTGRVETNPNTGTLTVSGSSAALNSDAIAATDISGYSDISLQLVVTGTNTTTFQGSNDNFVTTFSVNCQTVSASTTAPVLTTTASGLFTCPVKYRYFRARTTAFTSGTSTGIARISPLPTSNDLGQRSVTGSGTFTVSGTVTSNPATGVFGTQLASAARTVSGNSGTVTQTTPNNNALFEVNVTVVSGTAPTLDVVFQESYDNGTTWTDEWHWERITTTGQFSTPNILINTSKFRYVWTITGTTPSFTFSIGGTQGSSQGQVLRRFFDRTIDLNTLNSTSAVFNVDGCKTYAFNIAQSACGAFPVLYLDLSEDSSNFAPVSSLTTTANGYAISQSMTSLGKFARLRTATAGTGCSTTFGAIRCSQY